MFWLRTNLERRISAVLYFPPFGSTSFLWHLRLRLTSVLIALSCPLSGNCCRCKGLEPSPVLIVSPSRLVWDISPACQLSATGVTTVLDKEGVNRMSEVITVILPNLTNINFLKDRRRCYPHCFNSIPHIPFQCKSFFTFFYLSLGLTRRGTGPAGCQGKLFTVNCPLGE